MKVIFGLGNPGLRFRSSRHNLGFSVVEQLAKGNRIRISRKAGAYCFGQGKVFGQETLLVKPLTFMNLSGQAAALIVKQKKIRLADLLVICDDINLPLGKIRIRSHGSAGGHKGLLSLIEELGSQDFARLRIGVGRQSLQPEKAKPSPYTQGLDKLSKFVLGRFNKKEIKMVNLAVEQAVAASRLWLEEGIAAAMDKFN